jgi:hypothetical protein
VRRHPWRVSWRDLLVLHDMHLPRRGTLWAADRKLLINGVGLLGATLDERELILRRLPGVLELRLILVGLEFLLLQVDLAILIVLLRDGGESILHRYEFLSSSHSCRREVQLGWPVTGRTAFLNARCKPESKDALYAIAEKLGVTVGAALDEAIALLAARHKMKVKS